jgi:hypothetical protein
MTPPRFGPTRLAVAIAIAAAVVGAVAGCGGSKSSSGGGSQEAQSAATGDIPDNQTFLRFQDRKAGYSIKYPEGWARKGSANDTTFSDKLNSVRVLIASGPAPSAGSVSAELHKQGAKDPTLKPAKPQKATIGGAPAIHVVYRVQSQPDPVTNQRRTLVVDRYVLAKGQKTATVDLATPVGVDNVDAYRLIVNSFRWG